MDEGNNDDLYQDILKNGDAAQKNRDAKAAGGQHDDLVDKEMINLLQVCRRLAQPHISEIKDKMYNMGPKDGTNKKVLILDMDETMLHAKFLQKDADEKTDDSDFTFTL